MTSSRFWIGCGLVAFAGGMAFAVAWQQLATREEIAAQRADYIENEIRKRKLEVAEIETLDEARSTYDAMARAAGLVQTRTVYAAEALAELSRLPRPLFLISVTVENNRISLVGESPSEADLARLRPALEQGRYIGKVHLEETVPLAGKYRFRLEAELPTSPSPPSTPAGK